MLEVLRQTVCHPFEPEETGGVKAILGQAMTETGECLFFFLRIPPHLPILEEDPINLGCQCRCIISLPPPPPSPSVHRTSAPSCAEGTALASKAIEAMRDIGCEEVREAVDAHTTSLQVHAFPVRAYIERR